MVALPPWQQRVGDLGAVVLRYSLVFFFLAFGLFKFTPQEATAIEPLMKHSPVLFWVDPLFGVRGGSALIGIVEVTIGVLIALRRFSPRWSSYGSLAAAAVLVTTLSFLFTTPGLDPQSVDAGFLLKDLTLLGAALWSAGEAASAARVKAGASGLTSGYVASHS
jgi:reactive chlorine resistance protein C